MQREGERFELGPTDEPLSSSEVKPAVTPEKPAEPMSGAPFAPTEIGPVPKVDEQKDAVDMAVTAEPVVQFSEGEVDSNIAVNNLSELEDRMGQVMDSGG